MQLVSPKADEAVLRNGLKKRRKQPNHTQITLNPTPMKPPFIILSLLMITGLTAAGQLPQNCSQVLAANPLATSGVYTIDPDGEGTLPQMDCYCDMVTDGGGWTLILNYNHLTSTNPSLRILTGSLPLQGETMLGFDESNSVFWGHADTALMHAIPFDEVRFYGISSEHDRTLHFKSSHPGTIAYFKTGIGSTEGINASFTALNGHNSNLPASINMSVSDRGNYAMTDYPLWTGSLYHWYLAGIDSYCSHARWEVDDYPCFTEPSTFHQIWIRQNNATGQSEPELNEMKLKIWPNPADDRVYISTPLKHSTNTRISIYTLAGVLLCSETVNGPEHRMDTSVLGNGIYLMVVASEEGTRYQQLAIQR